MSHAHQSTTQFTLDRVPRQWRVDGVVRLKAVRAGWLQVDEGRLWLTRDGGGDDLVLAAGDALWLGRGEGVLLEPWRRGQAVALGWSLARAAEPARPDQRLQPVVSAQPLPPPVPLRVPRPGLAAWDGLARGLRWAGLALLAAARSAEARARRAQGAMPAGESMASSGALQ